MIHGIGVDIVEIERIEQAITKAQGRFQYRIFTASERDYCEGRVRPAEHYAARFAAKEAFLKCLGYGIGSGIALADIEVTKDAAGQPGIVLSGPARGIVEDRGIHRIHLSLSHSRSHATAVVICESGTQEGQIPDERQS